MAYCPNCGLDIAADASQCSRCMAIFGSAGGWTPKESPPSAKERGRFVFARFLFGTLIPALIYSGVLAQLAPWWGGASEYRGLNNLLVIVAGILALLVNCWIPFVSWMRIPNAFFAGMLLPCLALLFEAWSGSDYNALYQYYTLIAYTAPVSTCILFCIYMAWGYVNARSRPNPTVERDARKSGARPSL
jgi:hypothetical protein